MRIGANIEVRVAQPEKIDTYTMKSLSSSEHELSSSDFLIITERGGERVSRAQLERFYQRYIWAGRMCAGKDVLEMACGTGPGLGHLQDVAQSLVAGDISPSVLDLARAHYQDRIDLRQFDATTAPFPNENFDVIILFEAIYYFPDVDALFREVRRLLRPSGKFLLATANKDLFDFNPSPYSHHYFSPPELSGVCDRHGFEALFWGGSRVTGENFSGKLIRKIKKIAVRFGLIPGSMRGKLFLKRLVFGRLVLMPIELKLEGVEYSDPVPIPNDRADTLHQVLYCVATKTGV